MTFVGVTINGVGILIAGILGALIKKGIPQKFKSTLMAGLGLCVLYSGVSGFEENTNLLVLTASIVIGLVIGELLDFDAHLTRFGQWVQRKLAPSRQIKGPAQKNFTKKSLTQDSAKDGNMSDGFVEASLIVCVGAMAIVGAIESGTKGTYEIYLAKSFIDIVTIFLMASSKGAGCCLAGVVCFVYEGLLTLGSSWLASVVNETTISQMSQVGSLLVATIGLNLLEITHIKIANFILAPFVPVLIYAISQAF